MKFFKINPLFFAVLMPSLFDIILTVIGQDSSYWSNYSLANEASPGYYLLIISPWLFLLGGFFYLGFLYWLILRLRYPVNIWLALLLLIGHSYGSTSWLNKLIYKFQNYPSERLPTLVAWNSMIAYFVLIAFIAGYFITAFYQKREIKTNNPKNRSIFYIVTIYLIFSIISLLIINNSQKIIVEKLPSDWLIYNKNFGDSHFYFPYPSNITISDWDQSSGSIELIKPDSAVNETIDSCQHGLFFENYNQADLKEWLITKFNERKVPVKNIKFELLPINNQSYLLVTRIPINFGYPSSLMIGIQNNICYFISVNGILTADQLLKIASDIKISKYSQ